MNAPYSSIKLSAYKGKVLILDFWATWCGSCIAAMHEVEPLQKKYADRFQVLAITYEEPKHVTGFLQTTGVKREFSFPIATSDKLLVRYFPYRILPHEVWLDADQRIIAITNQKAVTEANIQTAIAGGIPKVEIKNDRMAMDKKKSLYENIGEELQDYICFQSLLTQGIPGVGGSSGFSYSKDSTSRRFHILNFDLINLMKSATGFFIQPNNRVIIEDAEINKIKSDLFCYELTYSKNLSNSEWQRYMKQDLERFFQVNLEIVPRTVSGYALRLVNNDSSRLVTKGGKYTNELTDRNKPEKRLVNAPISVLLESLNSRASDMPIILDQTRIKTNIDLVFEGSLTDLDNINKNLARYQLELLPVQKEINMLVVSSAKHSKL
ncbi:MAG: TlpA family protein disulfide reductase [Sphingobacteriia bacterium]|nr:TlpA family protein disulfide reductase [Sphingobacteriia bacterium]